MYFSGSFRAIIFSMFCPVNHISNGGVSITSLHHLAGALC